MDHPINYAKAIVEDSLKINSGEEATIFTDESRFPIADEIAGYIARSGSEVSIFIIPESIRPVTEVTDIHASALISSDIVIYVLATQSSTKDLSREVAFRHYLLAIPLQYKGRVCIMPGFKDEMKEAASIDYGKLRQRGEILKQAISGRRVRITSALGTDVSFSIGSRQIKVDGGDLSKPGSFGNIPAGEIFTAPVEETVEGKIVVDGSIGGIGLAENPFIIYLKDGYITGIDPTKALDDAFLKFSKVCEYDAPATRTLGEFGIGINPRARIIGDMLMDEKAAGTVHFAFGDSFGLGKTSSRYHTDLLVRNPTIAVDEEVIMREGHFLLAVQ